MSRFTKEGGAGWCTAPLLCPHCGHRWQSVYPAETRWMECNKCTRISAKIDLLMPKTADVIELFQYRNKREGQ